MKEEEYAIMFNCSLCGGNHEDGRIVDTLVHIARYTNGLIDHDETETVGGSCIYKKTVINCEDGGIAIGEFVGFKKIKHKEKI